MNEPRIDEIAPDVFRLSVFVPEFDLQFNHFLVRDDEPLLYHAGLRAMFPALLGAVSRLIEPARLRHVLFGHFESDECGSLNEWLAIAPAAQAAAGAVGTIVNLGDFAARPARTLADGETFETGRRRFRYIPTPHLPHGWDAGTLFEETSRTLFVGDLFHQTGDREALTTENVADRSRETLVAYQAGPLADYVPYTRNTPALMDRLASLRPRTLAVMHGSSYEGDGAAALAALDGVLREVLGGGGHGAGSAADANDRATSRRSPTGASS